MSSAPAVEDVGVRSRARVRVADELETARVLRLRTLSRAKRAKVYRLPRDWHLVDVLGARELGRLYAPPDDSSSSDSDDPARWRVDPALGYETRPWPGGRVVTATARDINAPGR